MTEHCALSFSKKLKMPISTQVKMLYKSTLFLALLLAVINQSVGADECPETESIYNWATRHLNNLLYKRDPIPETEKEILIRDAKNKISKNLKIDVINLDTTFIGSMSVTSMTRGFGVFPDLPFIPRELVGKPLKNKVIKVLKEGTDIRRITRDEIAYKEVTEVLGHTPNSKVKMSQTHFINLPDGTRIVIQDAAPGRKITDVFKDLFSDVFEAGLMHHPDDFEVLIATLSSPEYDVCLGLAPVKSPNHPKLVCSELIEIGVDFKKLAEKMKNPKIQNIRKRLHELRELSEPQNLPQTVKESLKLPLANKQFYNMRGSNILGLDMSIDNFKINIEGDDATIHVFDW